MGTECDGGSPAGWVGELGHLQHHLPGEELVHAGKEHQAQEGHLGLNYIGGGRGERTNLQSDQKQRLA